MASDGGNTNGVRNKEHFCGLCTSLVSGFQVSAVCPTKRTLSDILMKACKYEEHGSCIVSRATGKSCPHPRTLYASSLIISPNLIRRLIFMKSPTREAARRFSIADRERELRASAEASANLPKLGGN